MCTEAEMANYLEVAEEIAREAGKMILEGFHAAKSVTTKKGPWDLVTEYDRKVENLAFAGLRKKFPTHKFIGEETEAAQEVRTELTDDPTWIIDPIDGTTNFVHGFHETCISMGLSVKKELIVGVVYNPILDYMFKARKGHGAYLNNKRIYTSKCTEIKQSLIAMETSFARIPKHRETVLARLRGIVTKAHAVRSVGTAALSMCYVANGSIDAYHIDGLYSWDVAAGAVIIREAGGVVMDTSDLSKTVVAVEVSVAAVPHLTEEVLSRTAAITAVAHGSRTVGSAALIVCYIANGSLGAFQMDHLRSWDVAGGTVILREAGGVALHTNGGPFDVMSNKYLFAGNKPLADQLVDIVKKADEARLKISRQN